MKFSYEAPMKEDTRHTTENFCKRFHFVPGKKKFYFWFSGYLVCHSNPNEILSSSLHNGQRHVKLLEKIDLQQTIKSTSNPQNNRLQWSKCDTSKFIIRHPDLTPKLNSQHQGTKRNTILHRNNNDKMQIHSNIYLHYRKHLYYRSRFSQKDPTSTAVCRLTVKRLLSRN